MKITTAYFSATDTTRTVVSRIARSLSTDITNHNLTNHPIDMEVQLSSTDVLLVGMPVYGGRIPAVAVQSLQRFKGDHTPAILLAIYGNREFDDAFVEMQDLLEPNGFFILAGGAFIAQHSIFPSTAKGRPDTSDYSKMDEFAAHCSSLLNHGIPAKAQSVTLPGNRPYKIPGNIPLKVVTSSSCTECGTCISLCPVHAIPVGNPHITDYDKCIHCGRCISHCKDHARHYGGILFHIAGYMFGRKNRKRKEPQFFF